MVAAERTHATWVALEDVVDPEIPVISVVDLGIVRSIDVDDAASRVEVSITPTYSGCPAIEQIESDIAERLQQQYESVQIRTVLEPAWTTEWMSEAGRTKLKASGIAPPPQFGASAAQRISSPLTVMASDPHIPQCPRCESTNVERIAEFGSTSCKSLWRCLSCLEPFDHFKAL